MKFTLVDKFNEADENVTTFVWQPEEPLTWSAGQYLKYTLPHDNPDDRGSFRWFTIAAPPYELRPRITTRFTEKGSTFKTKLHSLKTGDSIEASKPMGDFILDTTRPAVMIAGGIGITPFRAMTLQQNHEGAKLQAHLLYSNRSDTFIFRDQFETVIANQSEFEISYFVDPNHIELEDIQQAAAKYAEPIFYISGPEPMVDHYKTLLTGAGTNEDAIKLDDFPGYDWPMH